MNILHLSAQKPDSTGSGVYLHETVCSLDRAGHAQAVIAGIGADDDPAFPQGVVFRPVRFETDELPFPVAGMSNVMPYTATRYGDLTPEMTAQFKAAFGRALDDVLEHFSPDLVVCHHLYLLCGVVAHALAQRKAHGMLPHCTVCGLSHSTDLRQYKQIPLERDFIREGVHLLDRIYALHDAQAAEIAETFGVDRQRIRVVGTGYNANVFREQDYVRPDNSQEIVYVGKICRKKGVESLLKALKELVGSMPDIHLTLVGGYNDEVEYRDIVDYAECNSLPTNFAGRLELDELVAAYNRADVFVLPSFFEGLPLVVVEALACGCKAVVTDLPGIRPWIEQNVNGGVVEFVEPPRMQNVDTPLDEDLPAFERRLAQGLARALDAPRVLCDTTGVSWDALAARLL